MRLICAALVFLASYCAQASPADGNRFLNREIDKLVSLYADGFAISEAKDRHVALGPLFGEGRKDAVAFFLLSGVDNSNAYLEYIAVFAAGQGRDISARGGPKERPYHLVATAIVGNRLGRTLDWKTAKIAEGSITVEGRRWAKDDAGCCPTSPIQVTFTVANNLIDEINPDRYPVFQESEKSAPP